MAHMRQSRPDPGLGFQVQVLQIVQGVPSSRGSGSGTRNLTTRISEIPKLKPETPIPKPAVGIKVTGCSVIP